MEKTWDGLPIAKERPFACCIVVWREGRQGWEFLLVHRLAPGGAGYEGDWAWTPPSGARFPGESPEAAASRELREETGLRLRLTALPEPPPADVALYVAETPADADVVLDHEHDEFVWLPLEEAVSRCLPRQVGAGLATAAAWLDARATSA